MEYLLISTARRSGGPFLRFSGFVYVPMAPAREPRRIAAQAVVA